MIQTADGAVGSRYRLLRLVGEGGMGRVWHARDETLDRDVALKEVTLPTGIGAAGRSKLADRIKREARLVARLNHPGIVRVYDIVDHRGSPVIVMEFIPGESLAKRILRDGAIPAATAVSMAGRLLAALRHAHAAGVVHRDIKPDNILLTENRCVLTDFGIARSLGGAVSTLTAGGMLVGTPAYLAPELLEGQEATAAADLWSLGATLFAAVEGVAPFTGETIDAMFASVLNDPVPPAPHAGPLTGLLKALLVKDPAKRGTVESAAALIGASSPQSPDHGPQVGAQVGTFAAPSAGRGGGASGGAGNGGAGNGAVGSGVAGVVGGVVGGGLAGGAVREPVGPSALVPMSAVGALGAVAAPALASAKVEAGVWLPAPTKGEAVVALTPTEVEIPAPLSPTKVEMPLPAPLPQPQVVPVKKAQQVPQVQPAPAVPAVPRTPPGSAVLRTPIVRRAVASVGVALRLLAYYSTRLTLLGAGALGGLYAFAPFVRLDNASSCQMTYLSVQCASRGAGQSATIDGWNNTPLCWAPAAVLIALGVAAFVAMLMPPERRTMLPRYAIVLGLLCAIDLIGRAAQWSLFLNGDKSHWPATPQPGIGCYLGVAAAVLAFLSGVAMRAVDRWSERATATG